MKKLKGTAFPPGSTGFILDKQIGVNCPKRIENAKILIANTCKIMEHRRLWTLLTYVCRQPLTLTRSRFSALESRSMELASSPSSNEPKRKR